MPLEARVKKAFAFDHLPENCKETAAIFATLLEDMEAKMTGDGTLKSAADALVAAREIVIADLLHQAAIAAQEEQKAKRKAAQAAEAERLASQ